MSILLDSFFWVVLVMKYCSKLIHFISILFVYVFVVSYVQWTFERYWCCYIRIYMFRISFELIIIIGCCYMRTMVSIPLFCFGCWILVYIGVCFRWTTPWSCDCFYVFSFCYVIIYVFVEFILILCITFPFFFITYFWCLL